MTERPWIQTYTGKQFFLDDPRPEDVCIEDIAHALALQCRYNGHCLIPYTVAEHCYRVSCMVSSEWALEGLLHDAAEAYLGDVVAPLKRILPDYQVLERRVETAIRERFGLKPMGEEVKEADLRMLATEARDLMAEPPAPWLLPFDPYPWILVPFGSWGQAERVFLERFGVLAERRRRP